MNTFNEQQNLVGTACRFWKNVFGSPISIQLIANQIDMIITKKLLPHLLQKIFKNLDNNFFANMYNQKLLQNFIPTKISCHRLLIMYLLSSFWWPKVQSNAYMQLVDMQPCIVGSRIRFYQSTVLVINNCLMVTRECMVYTSISTHHISVIEQTTGQGTT